MLLVQLLETAITTIARPQNNGKINPGKIVDVKTRSIRLNQPN